MNENTVEQPTVKRLERSRSDRMLAGVCGGLASYFDIHPAFYRVGFVVLTLLGGAGILVYAAAALVIPDEGKEDSIASAALRERRDRPGPLVGLALLGIAGAVLLSRASLWPHGDAAWVLLLLAGGLILWLSRRSDSPAPTAVTEPGTEGPTEADTQVVRTRTRRGAFGRGVAFALGLVLTLVLILVATGAALLHVHLSHGVGDRTFRPTSVAEVQRSYSLGVGDLTVDLSSVKLPEGETHVKARVDVGKLAVVLPAGTALRFHGGTNYGEVRLFGISTSGHRAEPSLDQPGARVLVLDGHVEAGKLVVIRAVG
jgi:phage shock protein PspC (stress-responsive transcriptional regulator)